MKKKTIIISGIATVLVIGSVVFCFAVKGDSTQPAEVAQTVTEAVATPTIEIPEEEPEVVEEVEEVPEVEVAEVVEETPEEVPEVEEATETEGSIVEVAETSEEVTEEKGVSTPEPEEIVKPAETVAKTKTEQTQEVAQVQPTETQPQQTTVDAQRDAIVAQLDAMGAVDGVPESNFEYGNYTGNAGAGLQWE